MNLTKEHWTDKDISDFYEYEKTLKGDKLNCSWEQRIVNTKLDCYARTSSKAREISKQIVKGNYLEFINKLKIKSHFDSLLVAFLINKIKDFNVFEKQIIKFSKTIDNWSSCDTLRFKGKDYQKLYNLSQTLIKNNKPFVRRVGVNIFFELIHDELYIDKSFEMFNSLRNEKDYYVNMCQAWLLSFCFIANREKTLEFFKNNSANDFVINKAISKCHDSYKVTDADKILLKTYKRQPKK